MLLLKQSTAVTVKIGPFLDSTDGNTDETGLTISQADVRLSKNGGNIAQKNEATSCTHDELGWYDCPLDTTDTNTLGVLQLIVHESGALSVWHEFMVLPANVFDSLVLGSDTLQVETTSLAANTITATSIASDAFTAAKFASDVTTEFQNGLATAAALDTIDNFLDTEIAAILADTNELQTDWADGGRLDLILDARASQTSVDTVDNFLDTEVAAILADTNELQTDLTDGGRLDLLIDAILTDTGTTLQGELDGIQADTEDIQSRLPAALVSGRIDASVGAMAANVMTAAAAAADLTTELQSGLATAAALSTVDGLIDTLIAGLSIASGTIGDTGNSTTALHLEGLTQGDDELNNYLLVITDVSASEKHGRWIEDFVGATDVATVATLPFTPENDVDTYVVLSIRQDVSGGSGLDAAGVRAAVGLASANLDTQLSTIDTVVDAILVDTGTTLQGELDGIQADTEDIQTRLPAALVSGRIDSSVGAMAANVMTAAAAAADLTTELQSGLATAAAVDTIDNFLDTEIAAIITTLGTPAGASISADILTLDNLVDDLESRVGTPSNLGGGATIAANLADIEAQTDDIGAAGAGLTAVVWNAAWDAEVQSEVQEAIEANRLDELLNADSDIDGAAPPTVGSVFHELLSKTAGSFTFDQTTDSLEAVRDRGDSAWITAVGFATHSAADVWAVATRLLTAGTNIVLAKGTGVTGFNDLSAAQVNTEADTALSDVGLTTTITGRIDAAVSSRATPAQVNAEVVDALATDTYAEPGQGTPGATISLAAKINYLFKAWRNNYTQTSDTYKLYNDAGDTVDQKATVSDDGTVFTRTEITSGP